MKTISSVDLETVSGGTGEPTVASIATKVAQSPPTEATFREVGGDTGRLIGQALPLPSEPVTRKLESTGKEVGSAAYQATSWIKRQTGGLFGR